MAWKNAFERTSHFPWKVLMLDMSGKVERALGLLAASSAFQALAQLLVRSVSFQYCHLAFLILFLHSLAANLYCFQVSGFCLSERPTAFCLLRSWFSLVRSSDHQRLSYLFRLERGTAASKAIATCLLIMETFVSGLPCVSQLRRIRGSPLM